MLADASLFFERQDMLAECNNVELLDMSPELISRIRQDFLPEYNPRLVTENQTSLISALIVMVCW